MGWFLERDGRLYVTVFGQGDVTVLEQDGTLMQCLSLLVPQLPNLSADMIVIDSCEVAGVQLDHVPTDVQWLHSARDRFVDARIRRQVILVARMALTRQRTLAETRCEYSWICDTIHLNGQKGILRHEALEHRCSEGCVEVGFYDTGSARGDLRLSETIEQLHAGATKSLGPSPIAPAQRVKECFLDGILGHQGQAKMRSQPSSKRRLANTRGTRHDDQHRERRTDYTC